MRKFYLLFVFLVLAHLVYAADIPQPIGWVNDFAGVISPEYEEKLNSLIGELEQKTNAEIAVVTVNSITPFDEKEYARLLFDNWKPGKKGKDNGVLVLLAIKERRWRIETGYGIEGILPDGLCGEIGRNYMVPYFKEGKYAEGIYSGITEIAKVIAKDTKVGLSNIEETMQEVLLTPDQKDFKSIIDLQSIVFLILGSIFYGFVFHWNLVSILAFFLGILFGEIISKSFLLFFIVFGVTQALFHIFFPQGKFGKIYRELPFGRISSFITKIIILFYVIFFIFVAGAAFFMSSPILGPILGIVYLFLIGYVIIRYRQHRKLHPNETWFGGGGFGGGGFGGGGDFGGFGGGDFGGGGGGGGGAGGGF